MDKRAKQAFDKLRAKGVSVEAWGPDDGYGEGTQFVLFHASDHGDQKFFDDSGQWIKESWVNDEFINYQGYRQDIVEILEEYHLDAENEGNGQATVRLGDNVHTFTDYNEKELKFLHRLRAEHKDIDEEPPRMSQTSFNAMKELARLGAPVWDAHSYSTTYDPARLPAGTQFVMTACPEYDRHFADESDGVIENFTKTNGLAPMVYEVVEKVGLKHCRYIHYFPEPHLPKELVCFIDPAANLEERGIST